MSIIPGQRVSASVDNTAFLSRLTDSDTIARVDFVNADVASGANLINIQKVVNSIASAFGMSVTEAYNFLITWATDNVGSANDTAVERINSLVQRFDGTGGHTHNGTDGQGTKISGSDLVNFNRFYASWFSMTITGITLDQTDVSSYFTLKLPGGSDTTTGVIDIAPNNKCVILRSDDGSALEDGSGVRVYGRITYLSSVWTLSLYRLLSGVETLFTPSASVDLVIYALEVYDQASRPTVQSAPEFGSIDITADVVDASLTARGVLNPSALLQELAGNKRWTGQQKFEDTVDIDTNVYFKTTVDSATTGSNALLPVLNTLTTSFESGGLTSVAGITVNAFSYSEFRFLLNKTGADIDVNHDSAGSNGFYCPDGLTFTWKQNTGIVVYYSANLSRWTITGGGSGSLFYLDPVGSSPNSSGASYSSITGQFNLQPADNTNPGILVNADQYLPGGDKIFSNSFGGIGNSFNISGSDQQLPSSNPTLYIVDNAALVSIARIALPNLSNNAIFKVLTNKTGVEITIKNNTGSPANERIITGTGADLKLASDASLFIIREPGTARWHVVGGSGGSSGYIQPVSIQSIAPSAAVTISLTEKFQFLKVKGNTTNSVSTLSATPFGTSAPSGGTVIKVLGTSDADQFRLVYNNAAYGCILNGDATFGNGSMMELIFDSATNFWMECSRNF